ncbi:MAG: fimbria/pilus outer membrane usher protein [Methyloceanibacter sp.]
MPAQLLGTDESARELQLELFINGAPTGFIGSFAQRADGSLVATPEETRALGLKLAAGGDDGLVYFDRLPGVSYRIEEASQRLYVEAAEEARLPRIIDARAQPAGSLNNPQRNFGAVFDYSLFANVDGSSKQSLQGFPGLSAQLGGRVFGRFGTLNQSVIASSAATELGTFPTLDTTNLTRLQSTWVYSDRHRLMSYRAGDVISGGLSWTRPVWLGGVQAERNFGLRPDLVTLPLPVLSGTAAVPSTFDVYTHNVKTFTGAVPAGPFEITNLPISTGAGTARLVVHDVTGRETVTTLPFYTSSQLLRQGLFDFSAEVGYPRRYYGIESNNYNDSLMGSGSLRYGWADWLTLEGHAEAGDGLVNGGAGVVFPLGARGVASVALAGSSTERQTGALGQTDALGQTGALYSASVELGYWGLSLYVRTQRTLGDYEDIASLSADPFPSFDQPISAFNGIALFNARPPKVLDQMSLSVPLRFDPTVLNLSYSQIEQILGDRSRIVGFSCNRPVFRNSSIFASAFADIDNKDDFGVFAGITVPFGKNISTSTGVTSGPEGVRFAADASRSEQQQDGSYGWYVRDSESIIADRSAGVSYRASFARMQVGVQQWDETLSGIAALDGSVAVLGGGVFFANRIDDAFAVVDAGAPNVTVQYENRPVGETNGRGLLLVPYLKSFQDNKIAIDPANLPIDAEIPTTRAVVVPADRGGVVVKFGIKEASQAALVTLVDDMGSPLGVGEQGRLEGDGQTFIIGYDGQAYIRGLAAQNVVTVERADGATCQAVFDFDPRPGEQVAIDNVMCR